FLAWDNLLSKLFWTIQNNIRREEQQSALDFVSKKKTQLILFDLLDSKDFKDEFGKVSDYYDGNENKRWGLAQKVQEIFTRYLKLKPQLLTDWEEGKFQYKNSDRQEEQEQWQQYLWRKYRAELNGRPDDYTVYKTLKNGLDTHRELIFQEIPAIHIVRTEFFATAQLELLEELSNCIPVYFYQHFIPQGKVANHPTKLWKGNQDVIENQAFIKESVTKKSSEDVFENLSDNLKIVGHYTPYREVEGLLNEILSQADANNGKMESRKYVVYCQDLQKYTPAIHHFFNLRNYRIPYKTIGEYTYDEDTPLQAFYEILDYDESLMKPENLMGIIENSTIAQRFNFEDFEEIRRWINEANIRYSYAGDSTLETDLVAWKKGLERLIYGSMTGENDWTRVGLEKEEWLIDATESRGYDQLFGLADFVEKLYEFKLKTNEKKTIENWIKWTDEGLDLFFGDNTKNIYIDNFKTYLGEFHLEKELEINFKTWFEMLKPRLENIPESAKGRMQGIIFTELSGSQAIPAENIAVLGLNYDAFPAVAKKLDFDLLKDEEENKITSPKEKDKNLFLKIISGANEKLYLSYQSRSPKDNEEQPPSILIEQLMNTLDWNDKKIIHHPLHGFSSQYNQQDESAEDQDDLRLKSYTVPKSEDEENFKELLPGKDSEGDEALEEDIIEIDIRDFISFFQDSFKYYYNKVLGVYFNDDKEQLPDGEPFDLDYLQQWMVKNEIINDIIEDKKTNLSLQLKKTGVLPIGNLGDIKFEEILQDEKFSEIKKLVEEKLNAENKKEEQVNFKSDIEIEGKPVYFHGKTVLYDNKYYEAKISKSSLKYNWRIGIWSWVLSKHNSDFQGGFLIDDKEIERIDFSNVNENIEKLVKAFIRGQEELNPFYLSSSLKDWKDIKSLKNKLTPDRYNHISDYVFNETQKYSFAWDKMLQNAQILQSLLNK
ncbi:MAG TPA: exodeoxyribonuclease V subunit gamma, partial [Flavobacteriaceae bacterium]|nr:exodeoxyribonuclease V subunit gamma [Flavobacteriaceae bacterium]